MIRKPEWIRVKMQGGTKTNEVNALVSDLSLNTVCSEANCPNRMECFERGTATFMLLGKNCTRNCTFCNVTREAPEPVDPMEPENVAKAIKKLGLKHAVITSVTRDDLKDQGAMQFVKVTEEIRKLTPNVSIELLIPDMRGNKDLIDLIINSEPDVLNHNVETVPELYSKVRPMAVFERSLGLLEYVKIQKPNMKTKSGIMLGLGETEDQLIRAMKRLVDVHCDMLTLGQYLQPTLKHLDVVEYITPEKFDYYKDVALSLGFKRVSSAPLVRSSYHADAIDF
ncbi:lipoyl synthase [Clostridium algidicarnis]|uniref:lipoyl synthase n=1 Tax=Clostridium algidicarnis TaxID=37659 RepID=UPI001C0C766E|nr:lipoyl synthase [Clostridium algidicarnis]MBU3204142.1 lipoyl synthase [Clostridium algidicarnis]MBU3212296.1 lipoyl synthase [Clostridium algidicarnis]MBU3221199.1 lipoyl synthase [Clostridium algidicarnis]